MNHTHEHDTVEQRLRTGLRVVAETLTEDAFPASRRPRDRKKNRRRRRLAVGVGALTLIPAGLAAAAVVNQGPEYVDTIPRERIVLEGSVDGSRYLVIESDRVDECGAPVNGVELIEESKNLLGSEWSTTGYSYGEDVQKPCGYVVDPARYLRDPALFNASGADVGDSLVWVYAVHPDVDAVRITADGRTQDLEVHEVDGAGYAVLEIPRSVTRYTSELLIDGQPVPGSQQERTVRFP